MPRQKLLAYLGASAQESDQNSEMMLWIDDVRPAPPAFTHWARNYDQAVKYLLNHTYDYVSFDHDLGNGKTGYDIAKFVEQNTDKIPRFQWSIHSMNPVGARNIQVALMNADLLWLD